MEYKFRAWDNKKKEWLMGYTPSRPEMAFSLFGECMLFGVWGHTFDKFIFEKNGLTYLDDVFFEDIRNKMMIM